MTALGKKTDSQVVELYGEVMAELHRRGVVRSGNNPIADMAEHVIADYYGVEPEPPNTKSWDVTTKGGTRIQVKALRRERRAGTSPRSEHSNSTYLRLWFSKPICAFQKRSSCPSLPCASR